jgi:hypothetical protein
VHSRLRPRFAPEAERDDVFSLVLEYKRGLLARRGPTWAKLGQELAGWPRKNEEVRYAARFTMRNTLLCSQRVARFGWIPRSMSRLAMAAGFHCSSRPLRTSEALGRQVSGTESPCTWTPMAV